MTKFAYLVVIISVLDCLAAQKSLKDHPSWKYIVDGEEDCGQSSSDRIIGGKDAALGQYPWIARVGADSDGKKFFYCGGSLISKLYVVTVAHCIDPHPGNQMWVRLGEYDTQKNIDCFGGVCAEPVQDIKVKKAIPHEQGKDPFHNFDIALLRLESPANYNGWVSTICLPDAGRRLVKKAEVAGWGFLSMKTMNSATILQTLNINLLPVKRCKLYMPRVRFTEEHICGGGVKSEDSCGGDSGGPLMEVAMHNGIPSYELVALVSFGPQDCGNGIPAVYTNVSYYLKWILDHIEP